MVKTLSRMRNSFTYYLLSPLSSKLFSLNFAMVSLETTPAAVCFYSTRSAPLQARSVFFSEIYFYFNSALSLETDSTSALQLLSYE